ncbi:hypothetical protein [Streptomyces brevispora]|uniref:Tail terminator n=1 Tax=Streptomyces brevispora TaxID=887462 RepID=A0ABZ1G579_9ACTN|nr:hypothetical protein [Streptomyces brevispora]WSC14360.1 hypothetical protein OIE64_16920 [Streptomyces brevispora]WSC14903.1 hypothetical protein OIE64_20060 [Streptomyces brevispora]
MWADIELALMKGLRPLLPGVRVVDELPDKVETRLPLVSVQVAGGADDRVTDTVTVDIAAFAATRAAMWVLAEQARVAMHALAATHISGMGLVIDTVETASRPVEVPYGNPALRRAIATYEVASRAQAPA